MLYLFYAPLFILMPMVFSSFAMASKIPDGWFKACTTQNEVSLCNVQNTITAETGQVVASVALIHIKGKTNRNVLQITVPSARLIQPGVVLQVDTSKPQKIDYLVCLPDRCIAETVLMESLVEAFKKGGFITLTSVNFQKNQNPIKISLQGFAAAFDGVPLQQSDIDERQKKIQEFVNKNNEDFSRKLKQEQEKLKFVP